MYLQNLARVIYTFIHKIGGSKARTYLNLFFYSFQNIEIKRNILSQDSVKSLI